MRQDRIDAFCDWIETVPAEPPFWMHPDFKNFADLTDGEMMAAQQELGDRFAAVEFDVQNLRDLAAPTGFRKR